MKTEMRQLLNESSHTCKEKSKQEMQARIKKNRNYIIEKTILFSILLVWALATPWIEQLAGLSQYEMKLYEKFIVIDAGITTTLFFHNIINAIKENDCLRKLILEIEADAAHIPG